MHVMAEMCDFGQTKDAQIRGRIVIGSLDKYMSRELQMEVNLIGKGNK